MTKKGNTETLRHKEKDEEKVRIRECKSFFVILSTIAIVLTKHLFDVYGRDPSLFTIVPIAIGIVPG
jgi:hypothetical protein